ncbi:MAG: helix-turn-helix domain-containing GNAT family N-acetyltransferase [Cypionkella sp.]|uniref:helix-turn-helix domain-containing GNAT family N-acetyltransferase n=1 Tax=Cypionkella sp. TaxID=2811411 RepID=UPI002ABB5703|nr:helix-turn-helix domain-containing GNAT family N-acetyltransferase [Cypionkella sp.]MDZ4310238.1 helix-turn-helix domain-containing GNAT family N-acetyltransferase [Cypionkella sp.]MDZ4392452.1 helix-turn-helix domain-containing GNAT family N-acetyltransferase [Cypionkella sp.]
MLDSIARLRRFNRAVTRETGALDHSYLGRGRPLGAARVLQLVKPQGTDIADIRTKLNLDSGLLSRLLRSLEAEGLIHLTPDTSDRRRRTAQLTAAGQAEMTAYEAIGYAKAAETLSRAGARQQALIDAMDLIATTLLQDQLDIRDADPDAPEALACLKAYYALLAEKIAGVTPDMLGLPLHDAQKYRPPRGAFLIAWSDDLPVGCVSIRSLDATTAEVKRLWVDPSARGQGLARRLMQSIESRARSLGYSHLKLDTNAALTEAIALYRRDGWQDIPAYTSFPANLWLGKSL